jgi:uncharacterized protein
MIIKLYDIEDEITVKGEVEAARYKKAEDTIAFLSPLQYELTVRKFGSNVRVSGPVKGRLSLLCDRCLETFSYSVDSRLDIELAPRREEPEAQDMELTREEMDIEYFEGEEIDLDPYVFEEIMLNIPIKALCSEACQGICPECGQNRNTKECTCDRPGGSILGEKLKLLLKGT